MDFFSILSFLKDWCKTVHNTSMIFIQVILAEDTIPDSLEKYPENEFSMLLEIMKETGMEETWRGGKNLEQCFSTRVPRTQRFNK